MEEQITLDRLRPGQTGVVRRVEAPGDMGRRLLDLGLVPGAAVACVGRSPLGDPGAYRIREAVIAIRDRDARGVLLAAR